VTLIRVLAVKQKLLRAQPQATSPTGRLHQVEQAEGFNGVPLRLAISDAIAERARKHGLASPVVGWLQPHERKRDHRGDQKSVRFFRQTFFPYIFAGNHMVAGDPVTILMQQAAEGNAASAEALLPHVYRQLRAAAQKQLANERAGHTLQATALVHEAYLKLVGPRELPWQSRGHFYSAAAEAMRRILVDHARAKAASMRGGPEARQAAIDLTSLPDPGSERESAGFLILDEAIARLGQADKFAASVVQLRYFAGLSVEETARALGVSAPTVKRSWAFARGWLKEAIESGRV
jgi:RNA polymerase sigma factor (TIGR02999 family)